MAEYPTTDLEEILDMLDKKIAFTRDQLSKLNKGLDNASPTDWMLIGLTDSMIYAGRALRAISKKLR